MSKKLKNVFATTVFCDNNCSWETIVEKYFFEVEKMKNCVNLKTISKPIGSRLNAWA